MTLADRVDYVTKQITHCMTQLAIVRRHADPFLTPNDLLHFDNVLNQLRLAQSILDGKTPAEHQGVS